MKHLTLLLALALTACAASPLPLASPGMPPGAANPAASSTSATAIYAMRSGYDAAFLAPAAHYNELARCAPGVGATVAAPCSDPKVVDQLRKADASARALLDGAEDVARNHPELSAATAQAAAADAISAAEKILLTYGVK